MKTAFPFSISPQPDEVTCGPSCLHAVYAHYDDAVEHEAVIEQVKQLPEGGTLAVMLARHAVKRGYNATIYSCNLQLFDPTWFKDDSTDIAERLRAQMLIKPDPKLQTASKSYIRFLEAGGEVRMDDLTPELIAEQLQNGWPVIAGLSATWLWHCKRDRPSDGQPDDLAGEPTGHFVVVHGIDLTTRTAQIADPYLHEPLPGSHAYSVSLDRLIASVLLGIVTYDAKLLVIRPKSVSSSAS